jgi:hypothetical protein
MNQKHILPCLRFLVFSAFFLPQSFSFLPTSLLSSSPLLPKSPHFALEGKRRKAKLGAKSRKEINGSQNNTLEAGTKSEKAKQEIESKFPSFSSFFLLFSYMVLLK